MDIERDEEAGICEGSICPPTCLRADCLVRVEAIAVPARASMPVSGGAARRTMKRGPQAQELRVHIHGTTLFVWIAPMTKPTTSAPTRRPPRERGGTRIRGAQPPTCDISRLFFRACRGKKGHVDKRSSRGWPFSAMAAPDRSSRRYASLEAGPRRPPWGYTAFSGARGRKITHRTRDEWTGSTRTD